MIVRAARYCPEYITVSCKDWKFFLHNHRFKAIITDSLRFLVNDQRIYVYGFVIMSNHFHLIWQMRGNRERIHVQRDLLKFTSQKIVRILREENSKMYRLTKVDAWDREHQLWESGSMSVVLWTPKFFWQKLGYMHRNPVEAGLCERPEEYKYSSARYYNTGVNDWDFLTHYDG